MFSILVLTQADLKKKHEEMLREHATNHHPVPKVHKCSPAHPCAARDPDPVSYKLPFLPSVMMTRCLYSLYFKAQVPVVLRKTQNGLAF